MTTVWDSSVIIDVLRGVPAAGLYFRNQTERPVCSEVSRVEVLRGLRSQERSATDRLLAQMRWIPLDEPIARRAGELGRRFRASHSGMNVPDLVIAATALELGATLATANVRHFPMFAGLAPPY